MRRCSEVRLLHSHLICRVLSLSGERGHVAAGSWTTLQIVLPIITAVGVAALAALLFFLYRRLHSSPSPSGDLFNRGNRWDEEVFSATRRNKEVFFERKINDSSP